MGKKKAPLPESALLIPSPAPASSSKTPARIVDTHCHILSTYASYRTKYPSTDLVPLSSFVRAVLGAPSSATAAPPEGLGAPPPVEGIVDVWCECPVMKEWKEVADAALQARSESRVEEEWGGVKYNFVIGVHPHNAKEYDEHRDATEIALKEAWEHELCVGVGEIGLDYHYENSPKDIQKEVLRRQLALAKERHRTITIHTREADEDIWEILSSTLDRSQKLHIHCYTDSVELARKLLAQFPNLYIGITGVITFSTNKNTSDVIRLFADLDPPSDEHVFEQDGSLPPHGLRIVLETDSPYMVPTNLPLKAMGLPSNQRMPLSHAGMIPWTAQWVADVLNEERKDRGIEGAQWKSEAVLRVGRENARFVYGV